MQLPGDREVLHLSLGRGHEQHALFKDNGLDAKGKLQKAIIWQQSCHLHASAGRSQSASCPTHVALTYVVRRLYPVKVTVNKRPEWFGLEGCRSPVASNPVCLGAQFKKKTDCIISLSMPCRCLLHNR